MKSGSCTPSAYLQKPCLIEPNLPAKRPCWSLILPRTPQGISVCLQQKSDGMKIHFKGQNRHREGTESRHHEAQGNVCRHSEGSTEGSQPTCFSPLGMAAPEPSGLGKERCSEFHVLTDRNARTNGKLQISPTNILLTTLLQRLSSRPQGSGNI